MPPLGGSKSKERAILKFQRLTPMQKGKLLILPSVKSKRTSSGKFNAIIKILERRTKK